MKQFLALILFFSVLQLGMGQLDMIYRHVEVEKNSSTLPLSGAGGLNAPLFSQVDLNNDGIKDIYIYDRHGFVHLGFSYDSATASLKFDHRLTENFPTTYAWSRLVDYTQDGVPDLLTSSYEPFQDIAVAYVGEWRNNKLYFQPYNLSQDESYLRYVNAQQIERAILVSDTDLPAISDLDNDGDYDFLCFNRDGDYVQFYKNICVESGRALNNPIFELEDECWGKFYENGRGTGVTFSADPNACASNLNGGPGNKGPIHSGATITAEDIDGDGDYDLFFGDPGSLYLSLLYNNGTQQKAFVNDQLLRFPVFLDPAIIRNVAAASIIDLDMDGRNEVVASSFVYNTGNDRNVSWLYEYEGQGTNRTYSLISEEFMVEDMIDLGTGAKPAVVDIDGDGLKDILVSSASTFDPQVVDRSKWNVLYNQSTPGALSFRWDTNAWMDHLILGINDKALTPDFADLDRDGDMDLLCGSASGKLYYFENQGGQGAITFDSVVPGYMGIDIGANALGSNTVPEIEDVDGDGLLDILIGESDGQVTFFRNIGTPTTPMFDPEPGSTNNVTKVGQWEFKVFGNQNLGNPSLAVYNRNDRRYVLIGNEEGWIRNYELPTTNLAAPNPPLDSFHTRLGQRLRIALEDLDEDGTPDLIVGNMRGGISFFSFEGAVSTRDEKPTLVHVWPNPAGEKLQLSEELDHITIVDILGQNHNVPYQRSDIDISNLSNGVYIIRGRKAGKEYIATFVKI